jgi:hypothetical protein
MIFEGQFFYNGQARWNLGWATPNYAGAFLVILVAFLWIPCGRSYWRWVGLVAEAALYFLLSKTYSRGALVALVCSAACFIFVQGVARLKDVWRLWLVRAVLCGSFVLGTGLAFRLSPSSLDRDAAAINRLDLWRGGLCMATAAPLHGWGSGEAGRAYMNWYQGIDRSEGYTTMVNSYLHIAVERGLPFLALVLLSFGVLLLRALQEGRENLYRGNIAGGYSWLPCLRAAAGASLVAWAVANIFTTLWIEPKLWIVPAIATGIVMWPIPALRLRNLCSTMLIAGCVSVAMCVGIFLAGRWTSCGERTRAKPGDGVVLVERNDVEHGTLAECHIWPDDAVFGQSPGKELRRWIEVAKSPMRLVVHRVQMKDQGKTLSADFALLAGRQCSRLINEEGGDLHSRHWVLVHPSVPPPKQVVVDPASSVVVILPEIDELGLNSAWRKWGDSVGARVVVTPGVGLDIRTAWPEMIQMIDRT